MIQRVSVTLIMTLIKFYKNYKQRFIKVYKNIRLGYTLLYVATCFYN